MASNDYDAESLASADGSLRSEDLVDGGGSGESHRHDYIFNSKKRKTLPKWTKKARSSEEGLERLHDDGYSWRKYGQKDILGAKFPRDYYRCIYRNTQNCWATKQVQRSDDDPTVFEVTYIRTHSCSQAIASNDYDVVISYMRWDISNDDFISHLRAALSRRQISVHEDFNVVGAAPECRVLIIFLTSTYVSSYLLNTLEQQRRKYRVVYPIFYGISPSDLISNGKVYDSYFHEEERKKWQAALERLTQMPFYTLTDRSESELIDEIVRDALKVVCSSDKEDMIGMDVQVEQILSLLCIESPDVRSIGIWGTVGIGKTAIAEEIFRRISVQYETCVFVKDLHEEVEVKGHDAVREDFLSKLLEVEPDLVRMSDIKTSFLRSRLQRKRVLVILDDVNDFRDVETFLGKLTYFGPGSRVITTSRNRHVFVPCKIDHVYEVRPLDISKSLLLLDRGTFRSVLSPEFYRRLSLDLVKFSNGNPQVLQFCSRSTAAWDQLSEQVQKILPIYIPGIFERSCCGLDENERSIFLDIACFFRRMDKDDVAMLLDGCGFSAHVGFRSLVDKSLLTISHNMVDMLRFLQATGREIVRQESPDRPGDRSRLWNSEDIMDVFKCHDGTSAIEGIFLDMSKVKFDANPDGFEKMCNLRLLKIYFSEVVENHGVSLPQGLEYLPSKLRLLHWEYYPLSSLPQSFDPKNLVELNLQNSCAKKLWKGKKNLVLLEKLDLENSRHLVNLPISICKLKHLETLNLSGCSSLERFPDLSRKMKCLKSLDLSRTAIKELPSSISYLTALEELRFVECKNLVRLPDNAWSLRFKVEFRKIDAEKFSKLWNRFGWLKKVRRTPCSLAVPPVPVKTKRTDFHFLSYCYTCNKSLDHKQDIYLYRMDKDNVAMLLDGCSFSAHVGFRSLVDKSLLTISLNMVDMLRFLQAMGREIVRQESPDRPGDRSRLWNSEDIMAVFKGDTGTSAIEGIFLDLPKVNFDANPNVFEKMCHYKKT
ncbi:unnamed protein product, partial [Thlaspi arvense]